MTLTERATGVLLDAAQLGELVRGSGISESTIAASGLWTVRDVDALAKLVGWPKKALEAEDLPGIVFPYRLPGNPDVVLYSVRLAREKRFADAQGQERKIKYLRTRTRGQEPVPPFLPPDLWQSDRKLLDPSVPKILVEGEKKALAASSHGFSCIAIAGVDVWRGRAGTKRLHPLLRQVAATGCEIFIGFDSDRTTNLNGVMRAERTLGQALANAGAKVYTLRLPDGDGGSKQGLDDFLVASGGAAARDLRGLIEFARRAGVSCEGQGAAEVPSPATACTDLGNAERLVKRHGKDLRHVESQGRWYIWDGKCWRHDDTGEVYRRAVMTVRGIYAEAAEEKDADRRADLVRHAERSESGRAIRDMVTIARSHSRIAVTADAFDADPFALCVQNGTVNLRTGELRPHRREDLITKICAVEYDPAAEAPVWAAFLERIFLGRGDLVAYIETVLGYCLTGDVREQKMWFFYGTGQNGKSTLLDTVSRMLGPYAKQVASGVLLARQDGREEHPAGIADLQGCRLALTTESGRGRPLNEAQVKQLTGGDRIKARFMRQDFFEFEPTHKFIVACNHKPRIRGNDDGIWRRTRVVPFEYKIPDGEKDLAFKERLWLEAPGILARVVRGCVRWASGDFQEPSEVTQCTESYREDQDLLAAFLADCCYAIPEATASARSLYEAYKTWCEKAGERPVKQRTFGEALGERGFARYKSSGIFWKGIGIREGWEGDYGTLGPLGTESRFALNAHARSATHMGERSRTSQRPVDDQALFGPADFQEDERRF